MVHGLNVLGKARPTHSTEFDKINYANASIIHVSEGTGQTMCAVSKNGNRFLRFRRCINVARKSTQIDESCEKKFNHNLQKNNPHLNPMRHVELFTYCCTLQQLWEYESEISWQDYVKHRWRVTQERSLIFNSDPSEIALEVFIPLSVPDEAWTCLDWDPDPTWRPVNIAHDEPTKPELNMWAVQNAGLTDNDPTEGDLSLWSKEALGWQPPCISPNTDFVPLFMMISIPQWELRPPSLSFSLSFSLPLFLSLPLSLSLSLSLSLFPSPSLSLRSLRSITLGVVGIITFSMVWYTIDISLAI